MRARGAKAASVFVSRVREARLAFSATATSVMALSVIVNYGQDGLVDAAVLLNKLRNLVWRNIIHPTQVQKLQLGAAHSPDPYSG